MKQIEEMAKVMANDRFCEPNEYQTNLFMRPSEALYNAGYRKQSEVAREIFEEIHQMLDSNIECCKITAILTDSKRAKEDYEITKRTLIGVRRYIAELKNKYTEGENEC